MRAIHVCALAGGVSLLLAVGSAHAQANDSFIAPLPGSGIPGYVFPEKEATILEWLKPTDYQATKVFQHGWGVWWGLTSKSKTTAFGIPDAPVYMTWVSKDEVEKITKGEPKSDGAQKTANEFMAEVQKEGEPRLLFFSPVTQLKNHGIDTMKEMKNEDGAVTGAHAQSKSLTTAVVPDTRVAETVSYNLSAAFHLVKNKLFDLNALSALYNADLKEVPAFPVDSVAVKPVYKVIQASNLFDGKYFVMPAWPGTPDMANPLVRSMVEANGYGEKDWKGCIYVDATNTGTTQASGIDETCDLSNRDETNTYGLGDFVGIPVTESNVKQLKFDGVDKKNLQPGDHLILMAMHVSTREITQWTWQTFFWTPDPANPPLPSNPAVAKAMQPEISAPANHYAAAFAYQMINPNQPLNGGSSVGNPIIAYNPYLESGFPKSTFSYFVPVESPTGESWTGTVGVDTNCMTCHALAAVGCSPENATGYATDFYLPRDAAVFDKTLQTEFLWSIANTATAVPGHPDESKTLTCTR
ncbi:hypothetical protein [Rhodospirillum sp. A1_3_36]|uniref:hypothetical protein n=1 Tax=Rhodospirillum sp. A1_3_36 TaxID=3391666 RepID=UPI0039A626DC